MRILTFLLCETLQALEDLSLRYDSTVRNSENTIVQFIYGDDSLNPAFMEDNNRPVDFDRLHLNVSELHSCRDDPMLPKSDLMELVHKKLMQSQYQDLLPRGQMFHDEIVKYFSTAAAILDDFLRDTDVCTTEQMLSQRIWKDCRFTRKQIDIFFEKAHEKYTKAYVEPGEAIGATGAQSISEPGTQMTLKVRKPCVQPLYGSSSVRFEFDMFS